MTTTIGWVGNYKRDLKNFDVAYRITQDLGYDLQVAGPKYTALNVPHNQMRALYNACDLLLVTSGYEAHPLVVYESLACGTPVVIHGQVGDVGANKVAGCVYYMEWTMNKIKKAIEVAIEHHDILSESGIKEINDRWTWDKWKPYYIKMFEEASGMKNPKVLYAINEHDWSWDYMTKEINDYVYPIDTYYCAEDSHIQPEDFDNYDLIINHVWFYINELHFHDYPTGRDLISINGPSYFQEKNILYLKEILPKSKGFTTVSNVIQLELKKQYPDTPCWFASRGIDTSLFYPDDTTDTYYEKQEDDVQARLRELGVQ